MSKRLIALCVGIALMATPGWALTHTWDGAPDGGGSSPDGNWATGSNWVGDVAPVDGWPFHQYRFGGTTNLVTNNNLIPTSGGLNVDDITFLSGAGSFTLSGNYLDMLGTTSTGDTADIVNNSSNKQTISLRLHARPDYTTEMVFNTASGDIDVTGDITDSANQPGDFVRKIGTHTLTFSGNNTYRSKTAVDAGVLRITSNTALGATSAGTTITTGSAKLQLSGGINVAEPIAFVGGQANPESLRNVSGINTLSGPITTSSIRIIANGGTTLNITGGVTATNPFFVVNAGGTIAFTTNPVNLGTGHFWADSGGLTVLGVANNTWATTTFSNGTMRMDVANALPSTTNLRIGEISYGADFTLLDLNGFSQTVGQLQAVSATPTPGPVDITSATPATLTVNQSTTTTYTGGFTGAVGLIKSGSGTLNLSGASAPATNRHTGDTLVTGGTLALGDVDLLENSTLDTGPSGAQAVTFTVAGTNTYNLGGLKGADDLPIGGNTISVGANGQSTSYSGAIGSTGALTKTGSGMLTLSGTNTYSGTTDILGGKLLVNGKHTGVGMYTVHDGATLGGTGLITAPVTVEEGGTIAPGTSTGELGIGSVVFKPESFFDVEINDYVDFDVLTVGTVGGSATLAGTLVLHTPPGFDPPFCKEFVVLTADQLFGEFDAFDTSGVNFASSAMGWEIVYNAQPGTVTLHVVPEPTTLTMLGLGLLGAFARRRRARR